LPADNLALNSCSRFETIAMVFHELATSAAKYGALSIGNGHVSVLAGDRRANRIASRRMRAWDERDP
jgi:two-component sensor histidine kinase